MKTTNFEQTIVLGLAEFITFLERTLDKGTFDPNVSAEIFVPAVILEKEIRNSAEKYSERMLELRGAKD